MNEPSEIENKRFEQYMETFVEQADRYAIKGKWGWRTKRTRLHKNLVKKHLKKELIVGTISRWYPKYAILDMDDVSVDRVDEIRGKLGLDESNSMLNSSESTDSYHLLFRPMYNGEPQTAYRLQAVFKPFVKTQGIELYPQKRRVIRLPFGIYQECLDYQYQYLTAWVDKMYWFSKLDDFNIGGVPSHQTGFDLTVSRVGINSSEEEWSGSFFQDGRNLFKYGLQAPSTRHNAQFKVIHYFWRNGVSPDETIREVWKWMQKKNHGHSKTLDKFPHEVKSDIDKQVEHVYTKYDFRTVYPDDTHNTHNGYICKPDMEDIAELCSGSLPRMRFLYNIVKYSYPRRFRTFIPVNQNKLIQWSSNTTYNNYLKELEEKGIANRGKAYSDGSQGKAFSKNLKLKWKYKNPDDAVLYGGRSLDSFDDAARLIYDPRDFRDILRRVGVGKGNRSKMVKSIFTR
jgi:hypothetical protein